MANIIISKERIMDKDTGEILGYASPKFPDWNYAKYLNEFKKSKEIRFLEPMTAQELDDNKLQQFITNNKVIGEQKFDGHRGLIYLTSKGNRIFSRRVSKQTGWFAENTDQMPHIRDIIIPSDLYGTVIDGEILLPIENCSCRQVQSVTGALPETAIMNQLESGFSNLNAFDILYYKGINVQMMPLWKRKYYLYKVLKATKSEYLQMCKMYGDKETIFYMYHKWGEYTIDDTITQHTVIVKDLEEQFRNFLKEGKEGLVIKPIEGVYEQKRSKAFIKMKAHKTYDVVIMGYEAPTREYTGKEIDTWDFWEAGSKIMSRAEAESQEFTMMPVTKFYAMGWIGAVVFGVWKDGKLVEVGRTSGMDEETRQAISENREEYKGQVIEVEAQGLIDKSKGSLQHPRFICIREDKNSESCTFEEHIRNY